MAAGSTGGVKEMSSFAIALVILAIVSVLGIVVLTAFKTSGVNEIPNATIDLFIAGIATFGSFAVILALVLITKIIIKLVKGGM